MKNFFSHQKRPKLLVWSYPLLFSHTLLLFAADQPTRAPILDKPIAGNATIITSGADSFSHPIKNLTTAHRKDFVVGNSLFKANWVTAPASVKSLQGLGPTFNAVSCSSCHFKDGRGEPPTSSTEPMNSMLVRMSVPGNNEHGGPNPVPAYGDQFNHRAILNVLPEGDLFVTTQEIDGKYPDGTAYRLSKPAYQFKNLNYGPLPKDLLISPRVAPAVFGLGLLETIDEKDILANADPFDSNQDGISGRPNYVWDFKNKKKSLGRFGWKANQPHLFQQNAGAFVGDMGITSPLFPDQNCPPEQQKCRTAYQIKGTELSLKDLQQMTIYIKGLAVPASRPASEAIINQGYQVFRKNNCVACHTESYTTGVDPQFSELSKQLIFPYTDLLLHDMGEGLADGRQDFDATGNEWRTPPLWSLGLIKDVNGHTRLLHDGRARNFEEAILWHGGEAEKSKNAFMNSTKEDRAALLKFLEIL